ncbi:MAG: DUF2726 domain-containing protein [Lachnospiraceae bacterium]|nr:DUF2726 domain-containing protein [Lachnospiraceae bacterium]
MNAVYRDIFKAIHEGKWLSIEYRNQEERLTKYWIGIRDLDVHRRILFVDGLHLGKYAVADLRIKIDSIQCSQVVEGSYCPVNQKLVEDIYLNPHKYKTLFDNTANLKILSYLEMCNRLDTTPYIADFELVRYLDRERLAGEVYELSEEQFREIVKKFQYKTRQPERRDGSLRLQQLAMNVLSIHLPRGLHVLAYRSLNLDIKKRVLRPDEEITVCTEFTVDGSTQSIRRYLDAEDYELVRDFAKNQERIKECVNRHTRRQNALVDDMPYIIGLGMDIALDLHKEYKAILKLYQENRVPVPIKAFFGDLLERPRARQTSPIALINQQVNMDQLLAINNAMKYPVAYIQGPPGTGKTNTILNTIMTAFFNDKTVLFASNNNHPIDGVCGKLTGLEYRGKPISFPILRLGNRELVREAILYIRELYQRTRSVPVFESTLDRNRDERKQRARKLSDLLKKYDEALDLQERGETIRRLLEYQDGRQMTAQMLPFQADLGGRQLKRIKQRLDTLGRVSEEQALALVDDDVEELKKYLYYTGAGYMKRLDDKEFEGLRKILQEEDLDKAAEAFAKYLGEKKNLLRLQKIFPIIATTCISAHRLGDPEPMFDMVIMDEASQCNMAVSLVPILRGNSLMLVGDPQQLSPVILLDELTGERLKRRYCVTEEYDYRRNSIYKVYLACDAVSDEILLHNHYRCHPDIIGFNNKKYYNSRLQIKTVSQEPVPLEYMDMHDARADMKNTAPAEARAIAAYAAAHRERSIGIITPFVNQKQLIEQALKEAGVTDVTCGTVHAFQGDEKEVILFSTAVTDQTQAGTYEWLKNNKELINVATSRARDKLVVLGSQKNLRRLHQEEGQDDLYELVQYVCSNGKTAVTPKKANSRALGVKPFSTATEEAFLQNLTHALGNIWLSQSRYAVHKEVPISQVFQSNDTFDDLFYTGRFDFVVYEKQGEQELPMLAIELDGKEHYEDEVVRRRDEKKNQICREHHLQIIRVENSYARRYNHIKDILLEYFSKMH